MNPISFLSPSGGLAYHYLAHRKGSVAWNPFRVNIFNWLQTWKPKSHDLIIVGPSGGYCLDARFLGRFRKIFLVEPDPIARWIFKRRFASIWQKVEIQSIQSSPIKLRKKELDPDAINPFFDQHQNQAILFSNVLGQLHVLSPKTAKQEGQLHHWQKSLSKSLMGREWASFHDRFSSQTQPKLNKINTSPSSHLSNLELAHQIYPKNGTILTDHQSDQLFVDFKRTYFHWPLLPNQHHLIEAVHHQNRA